MNLSGGWSVWQWACLRAAGFSVDGIAALRTPSTADAVAQLAAADTDIANARELVLARLAREPRSKPVNRAIKAIQRGELPADPLVPEIDALRVAVEARAALAEQATQTLEAESCEVARRALAIAAEPRFFEAVLWQNRVAAHGSLAGLQRRPPEANDSKTREQRRLVASYLQRYCVKNDTIGFFGPVGWAQFVDAAQPIEVRPGASLLATRHVYFEYWAVDALAQKLAQVPELRPHVRPRRTPSVRVEGCVLYHPNGKQFELAPGIARVLSTMDGEKSAREIAREVSDELPREDDVFELLAELEQKKLCLWTLEIPPGTFEPERYLRDQLTAVDGPAGERALAELDRLEECRAALERAAGKPDALDAALQQLETTFEELTGTSATRKAGELYAGRGLVFEDCRRDLQLEIGRPVIERLAPALALVLDSARWFTYTIASRYERALRELYDELRREHGPVIELNAFQARLLGLFPATREEGGIVHGVIRELQARWASILDLGDASPRAIERRSQDLRPAVDKAFHAPSPGWPNARHCSPDLMIAARDVDAIRRGDYKVVLGEVHVGLSSLIPCLHKEHPDPEVLVRAREADLPDPVVEPVWSKRRNRADFFSVSRHDIDLERGETRSARPRSQVIGSGELVVEEIDRQLVVRTRDRRRSFDIIAFIDSFLIAESYAAFHLLGARQHLPRVTIDQLVVQRESWTFSTDETTFKDEASELGRLVAIRRFADRHGMPRTLFAKTDSEAKPFYVDLDSPLLVDLLARNLKRARRVVLSEMLPALDECWLPDASGRRYTSELRMVAVDPRPWAPIAR